MTEETRGQIEDAIKHEWHIRGRYNAPLGGDSYEYPVEIDGESVILRDGDCGLAKPTRSIPVAEWEQLARGGLWQRVGGWSFVRSDDPALSEIVLAARYPQLAGAQLCQLKEELSEARVKLREE